ncbi:hypothetical protein [Rhodanobacter sp. L36]|uniref:hypothetical protein n=1 Tax=Rhodanobacter sp. L36 TaxID=1747221 RepID=UPI00131AFC78|nr:hypothetical protein [Rhodanobacter sp. L36]
MDVDSMIATYVDDVTQLLPRKQRRDVALELRELVREELQGRAAAQGRVLDADIALAGLRAFGTPQDVAARYFEPWVIVPATQTRRFGFAAVIGIAVLVALTPLSNESSPANSLALAILAWLGVLVVYFGCRSLMQRRGASEAAWVPRERDKVNRIGSVLLIVVIGLGIIAYGAPGWLFAQLTHGHKLAAWLDYDPTFHDTRLPVLFVLWGCQAILFATLAVRGRWNVSLRRVDVALGAAVVLVLLWFLVAGPVFREAVPNRVALSLISASILFLLIDIGVKLYRGVDRVAGEVAFDAPSLSMTRK